MLFEKPLALGWILVNIALHVQTAQFRFGFVSKHSDGRGVGLKNAAIKRHSKNSKWSILDKQAEAGFRTAKLFFDALAPRNIAQDGREDVLSALNRSPMESSSGTSRPV